MKKQVHIGLSRQNPRLIEIEQGELVLVFTKGKGQATPPMLGVFKDIVDHARIEWLPNQRKEFMEFYQDPLRPVTVNLPGGEVYPCFVPVHLDMADQFSEPTKRPREKTYYFCLKCVIDIVQGNESIIERLASDPNGKYDLHIPIIRGLKRPYVIE